MFYKVTRVPAIVFLLCGSFFTISQSSAQQLCPIGIASKATDYRDRSTAQLVWFIGDNKINHLDPANALMQSGEYSLRVFDDIDFTLVRYPNHHDALRLMVEYSLAGGVFPGLNSPECYFQNAKAFAADDGLIYLAEAYYHSKKNNFDQAVKNYQEAIDLLPNSSDARYNLALLYFDKKDYEQSYKYAKEAYGLGYPLLSLRNKLQQLGFFFDHKDVSSK